ALVRANRPRSGTRGLRVLTRFVRDEEAPPRAAADSPTSLISSRSHHMKIAIISPPWVAVPPQAYGGTENVIDTLARGLVDAGHEVLLFATGDSTCPVPTEWVYPRAVGTATAASATELRHVVHAYERALEWGADVVHDHTLV